MEQQKNESNIVDGVTKESGMVSTSVGVIIVVLIVAIVGILFWRSQGNLNRAVVGTEQSSLKKTSSSKKEKAPEVVKEVNDPSLVTAKDSVQIIDVDYEIRKMDEQVNSVNESDFDAGNLSDASVGL